MVIPQEPNKPKPFDPHLSCVLTDVIGHLKGPSFSLLIFSVKCHARHAFAYAP